MDRSGQAAALRIILLHDNAGEIAVLFAEIPAHIQQPLGTVRVMEQERVEAAAVQAYRLAPGSHNISSGDEVVMQILVDTFA
ncbi:hypothetical protein D3C85_1485150 [compost metagenome]